MVMVQRSPSEMIRIIHVATGHIFELKVLDVDNGGHEGRSRVLTEFCYKSHEFSAQARLFENCQEWPSAIYLHRNAEIYLCNSSGEDMTIHVARVSDGDVNFRLVDPTRRFEFQWSKHRISA